MQAHGQSSVQTDAVEHLHVDAAADHQALHDVEAVQLGAFRCEVRQIPALRRWRTPLTTLTVQQTVTIQNPTDRAHRRCARDVAFPQVTMDRLRTEFTQVAVITQPGADLQNQRLHARRRGLAHAPPATRFRPVHTIQTLPSRVIDPASDGVQTHTEPPGDRPLGFTRSHRRHHSSTNRFHRGFFDSMHAPWKGVFPQRVTTFD